ncbi:uncharacterized protein LOC106880743 isoform X2 [Octopus bimaculoides]|uniref:uncharacterized protein LOC106880743 isoform X2 n=1 Tax=Octopus bimaculoides TaxID=37653 RepID=UPI0022E15D1F|nr:uncharacterized protein LOC106880743 isoform X2 [Octopus bimaculoides]
MVNPKMGDDTSVSMHLVQCPESEFNKIIDSQSTEELTNSISFIQNKIKREQQEVQQIQTVLESDAENKDSSDTNTTLKTQLNDLNSSIAALIHRSMKCFEKYQQKTEQATSRSENTEDKSTSLFEETSEEPGKISAMDKKSGHHMQLQNGYEDTKKIEQKGAKIKSGSSDVKELPGKTKRHTLIQEFSSRSAVDDIRTEIARTVDRSAKENVSKFLLKTTGQNNPINITVENKRNTFENPDAKSMSGKSEVKKIVDKPPDIGQIHEHQKLSKSEIGNNNQQNNLSTLSTGMAESLMNCDNKQSSSFPHTKSENFEETTLEGTAPKMIAGASYSVNHTETRIGTENRISKSDMVSRAKMLENFLQSKSSGSDFNNIPHKKPEQVNEIKLKNVSEIPKENVKTDLKTAAEVSAAAAIDNANSSRDSEKVNHNSVPEVVHESSDLSSVQETIEIKNNANTFQEVKLNEVNISKENVVEQTNFVEPNHVEPNHDITDGDNKKTENIEGADSSMTNENSDMEAQEMLSWLKRSLKS